MYVHIGGNCTISDRLILGIFSLDSTTEGRSNPATRRFLTENEAAGRLMVLTDDLPRSFIVTFDGVYLSPVSVATLRQRLNAVQSRTERVLNGLE